MVVKKYVNNKDDIQKLLNIYISIINKHYDSKYLDNYDNLIEILSKDFNLQVDLEDIKLYYQPTIQEIMQDTNQLINNLGIRYE